MSHQANVTGKEIGNQDKFDGVEDNQTQVEPPRHLAIVHTALTLACRSL